MTDRTFVAVALVLVFLAFAFLALPADEDRATVIFILILFSPLLLLVAVALLQGPSRRERRRYWDYLDKSRDAGRSIDDALRAEARKYAHGVRGHARTRLIGD